MTLEYLTRLSFRRQVLFKYFLFLSMLLFCVPSAGAVVLAYITKIPPLRQVLYLVQSDTFFIC